MISIYIDFEQLSKIIRPEYTKLGVWHISLTNRSYNILIDFTIIKKNLALLLTYNGLAVRRRHV